MEVLSYALLKASPRNKHQAPNAQKVHALETAKAELPRSRLDWRTTMYVTTALHKIL